MGISVYTSIELKHNFNIFARYDYLYSNNDWDLENDLMNGLCGVEYKINKYIRISPNFRVIYKMNNKIVHPYFYLNMSFMI